MGVLGLRIDGGRTAFYSDRNLSGRSIGDCPLESRRMGFDANRSDSLQEMAKYVEWMTAMSRDAHPEDG
jgi:hypothetical protein